MQRLISLRLFLPLFSNFALLSLLSICVFIFLLPNSYFSISYIVLLRYFKTHYRKNNFTSPLHFFAMLGDKFLRNTARCVSTERRDNATEYLHVSKLRCSASPVLYPLPDNRIYSFIHSQTLIIQDGPLASFSGFLDHTHKDTR
jgi:hypothetical protein